MALTRDQILSTNDAADDLDMVKVPEWGGEVYLRTMSGQDRDRFESALSKDPGNNLRARLAAYTLCDESGNPLFTEADINSLGKKSGVVLTRLFSRAVKLNGIGKGDVDELEKNSGPAT